MACTAPNYFVTGTPLRLKIYAKSIVNQVIGSDYDLENNLTQLEFWVYVGQGPVFKFNKGVLKADYDGVLVKDDDYNFHFTVTKEMSVQFPNGEVCIDILTGFPDAESTELVYLGTLNTKIIFNKKPISAWQ